MVWPPSRAVPEPPKTHHHQTIESPCFWAPGRARLKAQAMSHFHLSASSMAFGCQCHCRKILVRTSGPGRSVLPQEDRVLTALPLMKCAWWLGHLVHEDCSALLTRHRHPLYILLSTQSPPLCRRRHQQHPPPAQKMSSLCLLQGICKPVPQPCSVSPPMRYTSPASVKASSERQSRLPRCFPDAFSVPGAALCRGF